MRGAMNGKLRQDVNRLQSAQTVSTDQIRKLEIEKIALEIDNVVLEKEKEELQRQVLAADNQASMRTNVSQWKEVSEFWANMGAKMMVRNALCSPELKEWLLSFATKCTNIGYTGGVTALFIANRQKEKASKFLFYGEGDTDGPKFIDGQIGRLQSGVLDFEFLNFIEANIGLSSKELASVFEHLYPEVEQKTTEIAMEVPLEVTEKVPAVGGSEVEEAGTSEQVIPEIPETDTEVEDRATKGGELMKEDLRNAKGTEMQQPSGLSETSYVF